MRGDMMHAATMNDWLTILYRELDEWNFDGVNATFWWRDDDAQAMSDELERMLEIAQTHDAPLGLAVIPCGMDDTLAARIKAMSAMAPVTILQHGFSHENHAPPDEKKMELGAHRPIAVIHQQLATGFAALRDTFGEQFIPVLVPPWNRIATSLLDSLAQIGFIGLSTYRPRSAQATSGLRTVNTHVDIIDWKKNKQFIGASQSINAIVAHLKGRRLGDFDSSEPTGLLTHHLVHDESCWQFLAQLLAALDEHPAVKWQSAEVVFCRGNQRADSRWR